ncbi:MAG: DUF3047 domain-containing protein [Syntrophaceae bacterium]|nr:DUF3047 domain-containing protein [Syntrophaceae bacterium]
MDNLYEKTERASLPIFCIRSLRPIWRGCMLLCMLITALIPPVAESRETGDILFHDDFMSLEQWKPLIFPKIKAHTVYSIVGDGDNFYLKAESNASASAIVYKDAFDASQYQKVRWRWKIEHVYKKGNAEEKSGDDYPIRGYITFQYDPDDKAAFGERLAYGIAKAFYGEYPPHSSLNYIWSNKSQAHTIMNSPYTDRAQMIILQSGNEKAGQWVTEEINILKDYKKAFGKNPPAAASIAIMNDSDDTGERAVSYIDFIEVSR